MITITNDKVAGFRPQWAPYPGFSLLFDNPGRSLSPMENGLHKVDCPVETAEGDDDLAFYRHLVSALDRIGQDELVNRYLFCPLPPYSYHVTVWDGLNIGNAPGAFPRYREELARFLSWLPEALLDDETFTEIAYASPLTEDQMWTMRFKFDHLANWGNIGLVAVVAPADAASWAALERLVAARQTLTDTMQRRFGVITCVDYVPHVSLGYFANKEQAELTKPHIGRWSDLVRQEVGQTTVVYKAINLYGFTDMATFFCK